MRVVLRRETSRLSLLRHTMLAAIVFGWLCSLLIVAAVNADEPRVSGISGETAPRRIGTPTLATPPGTGLAVDDPSKPAVQEKSPKSIAVLSSFAGPVTSMVLSPNGRQLFSGSYKQLRKIPFDATAGEAALNDAITQKSVSAVEPAGQIRSLAISADGQSLLLGTYRKIRLLDAETLKPKADWTGHRGYVTGLAFLNNKTVVSCSDDETLKTWSFPDGKCLSTSTSAGSPINALAVSPDGKWICTAAGDVTSPRTAGTIRVWPVDDESAAFVLVGHTAPALSAVFSVDGKSLITGGMDEVLRVWDLAERKQIAVLEGHSRPVNAIQLFPQLKGFLSTGGGRFKGKNVCLLWSFDSIAAAAKGEAVKPAATLDAHNGPVLSVAVCPGDKPLVVTGSQDKSIIVWDLSDYAHSGESTPAETESPAGATGSTNASDETPPSVSGPTDDAPSIDATSVHVLPDRLPPDRSLPNRSPTGDASPDDTARRARQLNSVPATSALPTAVEAEQVAVATDRKPKQFRVGIIGLDTSHSVAFTEMLNAADVAEDLAGCRVVAAYPQGSKDIPSSVERVPEYTQKVRDLGVEIVDSIAALLERSDVVLLETNDGRPHKEQALAVIAAGKPLFIDKPVAGSLADAVAIYTAAGKGSVPVFSCSSLRFVESALAHRAGKLGPVRGCDAFSPAPIEPTHPDLFWYGIHGVETLFTVMGQGCRRVTRMHTPDTDVVVGEWDGGRIGTFRGIRNAAVSYGGTTFGTTGIEPIGPFAGYRPLVVEIVRFFRTGVPPVSPEETLEIYAFMTAADESRKNNGAAVSIADVLDAARKAAATD